MMSRLDDGGMVQAVNKADPEYLLRFRRAALDLGIAVEVDELAAQLFFLSFGGQSPTDEPWFRKGAFTSNPRVPMIKVTTTAAQQLGLLELHYK